MTQIAETRHVDEPGFYEWWSCILRHWEPPAEVKSFTALVGFAFAMASFAYKGNPVCVSAAKLAERAKVTERRAKDVRKQCIDLGLFVVTGESNGKPVLRRALPSGVKNIADEGEASCTVGVKNIAARGEASCSETEAKSPPMTATIPTSEARRGEEFCTALESNNRDKDRDIKTESAGFNDKPLAELVSEAPDARALDALWRVHRGAWSTELTQLASARKAELASATANDSASAELASASVNEPVRFTTPLPTESASLPERASRVYETTCDDNEAGTVYESDEPESSRFSSVKTGYRGSLADLA